MRDATGYQNETNRFAEVVRILDQERIITPTEPDGGGKFEEGCSKFEKETSNFYKLTHDYLVPSVREWLTRKQKETRKGRAELILAERSALWNAKSENRYLPSLTEWSSIRMLTGSKHWTNLQREMMNRAEKVHTLRSGVAVASLTALVAVWIVVWGQVLRRQEATRIEGLVGKLISAEPARVPEIVQELDVKKAAAGYLSPLVFMEAKTVDEKRSQLHARLAMVSRDKTLVEPLLEELFSNKVAYIAPIRQ